jgi:hypothetical protein
MPRLCSAISCIQDASGARGRPLSLLLFLVEVAEGISEQGASNAVLTRRLNHWQPRFDLGWLASQARGTEVDGGCPSTKRSEAPASQICTDHQRPRPAPTRVVQSRKKGLTLRNPTTRNRPRECLSPARECGCSCRSRWLDGRHPPPSMPCSERLVPADGAFEVRHAPAAEVAPDAASEKREPVGSSASRPRMNSSKPDGSKGSR